MEEQTLNRSSWCEGRGIWVACSRMAVPAGLQSLHVQDLKVGVNDINNKQIREVESNHGPEHMASLEKNQLRKQLKDEDLPFGKVTLIFPRVWVCM